MIRRRNFLTLFGGAAATWPFAARAQQRERGRRIGVRMNAEQNDPEYKAYLAAFVQQLRSLGWSEGENLHLDVRWNGGEVERTRASATELLQLSPDAVLAISTANLLAFLRQGPVMPVVFVMVADPLAQGFVSNLAHPGGDITGFSNFEFSIGGKWVDLLKQMAPRLAHAALIFNPESSPQNKYYVDSIEAAAPSLGVEITKAVVHELADIEHAIENVSHRPFGGLILLPDSFLQVHRDRIIELAARYGLPAIYWARGFPENGGLMSYGPDFGTQFRQAAIYVDRILKGAKPGDLPVQGPTKFSLAINVKTARALGIEVPMTLLLNADEVME
jgi:putative ABC transport system substrate-binding protein